MFLFCWLTLALAFLPLSQSYPQSFKRDNGTLLQDIVTWDEHSLKVYGERLMVMSGEVRIAPRYKYARGSVDESRLPSPGLWLDVLQKIAALGFNAVSFYVDWALVEGKQGDFSAEGVFGLDEFYEAAKLANIYLIARPGPYINAEAAGGGLPGWIHRTRGNIRTNATDFMAAAKQYLEKVGPLIAKGQITNGGPVVLVQPENEYSRPEYMLSKDYMQLVEDTLRDAGIVVPLISDDSINFGFFAPGTGQGEVDIYAHNSYPLAFACSKPEVWSGLSNQYFPTDWYNIHMQQSSSTPYAILEFQAGSLDHWTGPGFDKCAAMTNHEFERVFFKQNYGFGVKIFNLYMIYGGTNWGNMGHAYGYTSYDYGAAIKEDRTVTREKYSELKLQANFLKVSPQYLVAQPRNNTNGTYTNTAEINVTPVTTNSTSFWVIRHAVYDSTNTTKYKINLPTSAGNILIPQLCGPLSLIFVTDYPVGSTEILYSTAEVFTWQQYDNSSVVVFFGGPEPRNEIAFKSGSQPQVLEGELSRIKVTKTGTVVQWKTSPQRTVFKIDDVIVYIVDRNSAYDLWVVDLPGDGYLTANSSESVIVKAGYLVRNASVTGNTLHMNGDINATTMLEILGAPSRVDSVTWNSHFLSSHRSKAQALAATLEFSEHSYTPLNLSSLSWKVIDSLPEISPSYDDSAWTPAVNTYTNNTQRRNLTTPVSMYGTDYGYNTGALIYRGRLQGNGHESRISVNAQGGNGFSSSMWLDDKHLDTWAGRDGSNDHTHNVTIAPLTQGQEYILTVVVDQNGLDESGPIGTNMMKNPRGILNYSVSGHAPEEVTWKLTGNLGGESYKDRVRGPLNEGGLYAERQGYHIPGAPTGKWSTGSPMDGLDGPGIAFYTTTFDLDMPRGWDIPLSFVFDNSTFAGASRIQIFINGWQYGKYASNLGPQTEFFVPEGILDYHGPNYIAISLWALEEKGAKLPGLTLEATAVIQSGLGDVPLSPQGTWTPRPDAY